MVVGWDSRTDITKLSEFKRALQKRVERLTELLKLLITVSHTRASQREVLAT